MTTRNPDAQQYANGFRYVVLDAKARTVAYTNTQAEALGEAKRIGGSACALTNTRRNPDDPSLTKAMPVPQGYYRKEVEEYTINDGSADYDGWAPAWWREVLQNSIDAIRGMKRKGLPVDATISLAAVLDEREKTWTVSCTDHGGGMSKDVFHNKFFTHGGSEKPSGSLGGFGEAKLLILCPWQRWSVRTQDFEVVGQGNRGSEPMSRPRIDGTVVTAVMGAGDWYKSYKLWTEPKHAKMVLEMSYLPDITVEVNGEVIPANLKAGPIAAGRRTPAGTLVPATFDVEIRNNEGTITGVEKVGYSIHYKRPNEAEREVRRRGNFSAKIIYRAGGLYMFHESAGSGILNDIIVELTGSSKYILDPKRKSVTNVAIRGAVTGFKNMLAKKGMEALEDNEDEGNIRQIFAGTGRFQAKECSLKAAENAGVIWTSGPTRAPDEPKAPVQLTPEQLRAIAEQQQRIQEEQQHLDEQRKNREAYEAERRRLEAERRALLGDDVAPPLETDEPPQTKTMPAATPQVAVAMSRVALTNKKQLEALLAQLAWRPDYIIENNLARAQNRSLDGAGHYDHMYGESQTPKGWKVPKEFQPEHMSQRVQRLLVIWTEMCRFVFIQLGCSDTYGVGFVFSHEVSGLTIRHPDKETGETLNWLLINPYKDRGTEEGYEGTKGGGMTKLFNSDNLADLKHIYAVAIHECTHLANRAWDHNRDFSSHMTQNIAQCADGWRLVRKIAKAATGSEQAVDVPVEGAEHVGGQRVLDKIDYGDESSPEAVQAELDQIRAQLRAAKSEKKRLEGKTVKYKARGVPRELGRLDPWPNVSLDGPICKETLAAGKKLFKEMEDKFRVAQRNSEWGVEPYQRRHPKYPDFETAWETLAHKLKLGWNEDPHAELSVNERAARRAISDLRIVRDLMDPPPYRQNELGVARPWPDVPLNADVCDETKKAARRVIDEVKAWHPRTLEYWETDGCAPLSNSLISHINNLEYVAGFSGDREWKSTEQDVRRYINDLRKARDEEAPEGIPHGNVAQIEKEMSLLKSRLGSALETANVVADERDMYIEQVRDLQARMAQVTQEQADAVADMQSKILAAAQDAMAKARAEADESYRRMMAPLQGAGVNAPRISTPAPRISATAQAPRSSATAPVSKPRISKKPVAETLPTSGKIVWQTPVLQDGGYVYAGLVDGQQVTSISWSQTSGTKLHTSRGVKVVGKVAEARVLAQSLFDRNAL